MESLREGILLPRRYWYYQGVQGMVGIVVVVVVVVLLVVYRNCDLLRY